MARRAWAVLMVAALMVIPAASASAAARAPDQPPTCAFRAGDTISRGGIGAVVPAPGHGVEGDADGPDNSSSSLSIRVDGDGVVTIEATTNGVESPREVCRLASSSKTRVLLASLFLAAVGAGAGFVLIRAQRRAGALVSPQGNR